MAKAPFEIVSSMEDDVRAVKNFSYALAYLAESFGDNEAAVVQQLSWTIIDLAEGIEDRRADLFHILHPNRNHFEKAGWPDAKVPS